MLDCYNKDWAKIHPEWGPVGGWWDWGQGHCAESSSPEQYISGARNIKITLDDGRVISKPVGIGIKFTSGNIQEWANRLNKPEFDNLAFLIAVAPGLYGEVTGGSYCEPDGRCFEDVTQWALSIMEPLSKAFPGIPIFYQGTINSLTGLCEKAATMANKNIGLKCNAWQIDPDNAQRTVNGALVGGIQGFADVYHDQIAVGFEPRHGFNTEEAYWMIMNALSHHPDILDIQEPNLNQIADFEKKYGFPLMKFTRDRLGKTLQNSSDLWVVLRTSLVSKVCFCGATEDDCMSPDCCYTSSTGQRICTGPQRSNFSYWLYQKDEIASGKTVGFYVKESNLPSAAKSHPYGLYTARRTDQANGQNYMYFDVEDKFQPPADKKGWEITLTFVNSGNDKLSLEYINKSGQTIKKTIKKGSGLGPTDNWVDYKWTLGDADFSGNKINGAEFRINGESDGDETVHRVLIKPVSVSVSPTPVFSPTPRPTLPAESGFYPGWQQVELKTTTKIPSNCQIITYKENGVWKNFLEFLGNLLYTPKKRKVWVKCN